MRPFRSPKQAAEEAVEQREAPLDTLIDALRSDMAEAQRGVDARHQGLLGTRLDLDGEGNPDALSYVFQVKVPGPDREQILRIPLLTLRPHIRHQITELHMELPVSVDIPPEPDAPMALIVPAGPVSHPLHRLRIAVHGPRADAGSVSFDGVTLKSFTPSGAS